MMNASGFAEFLFLVHQLPWEFKPSGSNALILLFLFLYPAVCNLIGINQCSHLYGNGFWLPEGTLENPESEEIVMSS